jgi:hypothetical protein
MQLCLPPNLPTTPILFVSFLVSAQKWVSFVLRRKHATRTLSFDEPNIIICNSGLKWRLVLGINLWLKPYMTCSVSFAEDVADPWKFKVILTNENYSMFSKKNYSSKSEKSPSVAWEVTRVEDAFVSGYPEQEIGLLIWRESRFHVVLNRSIAISSCRHCITEDPHTITNASELLGAPQPEKSSFMAVS